MEGSLKSLIADLGCSNVVITQAPIGTAVKCEHGGLTYRAAVVRGVPEARLVDMVRRAVHGS